MNSSRAVADRVECYMDELVTCFEDFVKKSLLLITVGIAAVVGVLLYSLKMFVDRNPCNTIPGCLGAASQGSLIRNMDQEDFQKRLNKRSCTSLGSHSSKKKSHKRSSSKKKTAVQTTGHPLTNKQSYDDKVLGDSELTSRSSNTSCASTVSNSPTSSGVPSTCASPYCTTSQTVQPRHSKHVIPSMPIPMSDKGSCCSVCCYDENL